MLYNLTSVSLQAVANAAGHHSPQHQNVVQRKWQSVIQLSISATAEFARMKLKIMSTALGTPAPNFATPPWQIYLATLVVMVVGISLKPVSFTKSRKPSLLYNWFMSYLWVLVKHRQPCPGIKI